MQTNWVSDSGKINDGSLGEKVQENTLSTDAATEVHFDKRGKGKTVSRYPSSQVAV